MVTRCRLILKLIGGNGILSINFNWTGNTQGTRQSINFSSGQAAMFPMPISGLCPLARRVPRWRSLAAADVQQWLAGQVRYKYQYVCVEPTPVPTKPPQATQTPENTPTETVTPITCPIDTENEKLDKILELYYARIPMA